MRFKKWVSVFVTASGVLLGSAGIVRAGLTRPPRCQDNITNDNPAPDEQFEVVFEGINAIVHPPDYKDANYLKAIIVRSSFSAAHPIKSRRGAGMPHKAFLYLQEEGLDVGILQKITGVKPKCARGRCAVRIRGLAFRIRGDLVNANATCPVDAMGGFTTTFDVPRLGRFKGVKVEPDAGAFDDTVNYPEQGVFVIEGGDSLVAEPFPTRKAAFFTADGKTQIEYAPDGMNYTKDCQKFAKDIVWSGRTMGRAVLEINTSGDISNEKKWQRVVYTNDAPLWVGIQNLADDKHPSSQHFALVGRIVTDDNLPIVCPCDDQGKPVCGKTMTVMSAGHRAAPLGAVPGCSDSGWP